MKAMLCSKCKVFSIHLANYDSFICEFGHVLCRSCSAESQDKNLCSLCSGHIIRQTEFYLEAHPRTRFRTVDCKPDGEPTHVPNANTEQCSPELISLMPLHDDIIITESDFTSNVVIKNADCACEGSKNTYSTPNTLSLYPDLDKLMKDKSDNINWKSRWEFEPGVTFEIDTDSDLSDSNTVIQHLTEFRKATNYTPPSTVTAYKVRNVESFYEPAIITTSKDRISSKIPTKAARNYAFPNLAQTIDARKVHANTIAAKDSTAKNNHPSKNQEQAYQLFEGTPQLTIEFKNSFSKNIREKLKNEIYSSFNEGKFEPKNEFMVKGVQGDIPPQTRFYDATERGKDHFLSDTITAEIEKALKNLNFFPRIVQGSVRRDEIVRQSKCLLRQRILEEVYSPFEETSETGTTDKTPSNHNLEQPGGIQIEEDEEQKLSEKQDLVTTLNKSDKQVNETSIIRARTIATSTESYPKLNPDLSRIALTKSNDKDAHFAEDAYIQEVSVFGMPSPVEANSSHGSNPEEFWQMSFDSPLNSTADTRKSVKINTLMNPIPILPSSDHTFPIKPGISFSKVSEPLYDIPEVNSDGEDLSEREKLHENTVYYCQVEHTSKLESPQGQSRSDRPASKPVAIQVGDYFQTPTPDLENIKNMRDFVRFFQKECSNLRLKDLKSIIMNIPSEENTKKKDDCEPNPPKGDKNEASHIRFRAEDELQNLVGSQTSQHLLREITITASRAHFQILTDIFSILPQYKTLPVTNSDIQPRKKFKEIPKAANLNIPRSPIICPISSCSKLVFVSEFSKHIKIDHERIPVECVASSMHKNVFFDPKLGHYGFNKCHAMYLVIDKIQDLGSKEYKDYLPVLLMSTKISLADILRSEGKGRKRSIKNNEICLMIWLTGLTLPDLPIYYTLIAWSRKCKVPRCHIAHSGQIYSIRNKQDYRSVFKSGQFLLLRYDQWMLLSNNGNDMMELQVVIH